MGEQSVAHRTDGKIVLDPCLGRLEVIHAKMCLFLVLIAGVIVAVCVAGLGWRWIQSHAATNRIVSLPEAVLVAGCALPAMLGGFLCVLEHSEYAYVRKVSPKTQLSYTPILHEVCPLVRRWLPQVRVADAAPSSSGQPRNSAFARGAGEMASEAETAWLKC